jgi:uncharacterized OB-fold protein
MPAPEPDLDSKPFWDGCARDEFMLPRCIACGTVRWPPGPMCYRCQDGRTEWFAASGRGSVYSWIVAAHPVLPVLADQVPYVVGLIELEEGVRVVGNVTGCSVDEVQAGMPVEVYFETADHGVRLPNFVSRPEPS